MRKLAYFAITLSILFGLSLVQAQENMQYWGMPVYGFHDFNASGFGGRSRAMGGTFMALNNEGYGSFLNPAGMVYVEKSLMSLEVLNSQDKFKDMHIYRDDLSPLQIPFNQDIRLLIRKGTTFDEYDGKHTAITQAGAVAPFTYFGRDWWFGGGYREVYDLQAKYHNTSESLYTSEQTFTTTEGVDALNMSVATSVTPNLSIGMNLNVYVRGYESNFYYKVSNDSVSETFRQRDKSRFSGANFDFAAAADFDMIRVGVVVRTGYTLSQNSNYFRGVLNEYGDDTGPIDRVETRTTFPVTYGGGVAFMPNEKLTVAADIDLKPYSKVRMTINPESNNWRDINDYDPGWQDLAQFRIGAEYMLDGGFAKIPIRAGFHNLPSLMTNGQVNVDTLTGPTWPEFVVTTQPGGDQMSTNIISFGSGVHFDRVWFDVAYEFGSSTHDRQVSTYWGADMTDPLDYKYSRLYISAGMLF